MGAAVRMPFPLFQSHLDKAKSYWKQIVKNGELAIDATCGNGHDTLYLAQLGANVTAIDIQQEAIDSAKALLKREGLENKVSFHLGCHSSFPDSIEKQSVQLVIYNLGYLPGGDKRITTLSKTTITSIKKSLELLIPGGLLSITCYPGHEEGAVEEGLLLQLCKTLDPKNFSCTHERWLNRKKSPSLLLVQKAMSQQHFFG